MATQTMIVVLALFMLAGFANGDLNLNDCGGKLNKSQSNFFSPNYPKGPYGSNLNCTWTASIPDGMFLIFDQFYLDGSYDSIVVKDDGGIIGRYYGIQETFIIQTLSDELTITFTSGNDSRTNLARLFSGIVQKDCKNTLFARPFGYISTPIIRHQNMSKAVFSCTWVVTNLVTFGSILSVQTANFTGTDASLLVYGGLNAQYGTLLGNFSADNPVHAVVTNNSQMFINLTYSVLSPPSITGLFRTTTAECTNNVKLTPNAEPTTISSVRYPLQYRNDLQCWWLVEADPGCTLVVEVSDVNLSDDGDNLVFYSSASRGSKHLASLGGSPSKLPVIVTDSNMMLIRFNTNDMGIAGGFSFNIFAQDIGGVIRPTASDTVNITLEKNKRIFHLVQTEENFQPVVTQVPQTKYPAKGNLSIHFFQDSWTTGEPLVTQTPADGIVPVIFSNTQTMLICAKGFDKVENGSLKMQIGAVPSGTNLYSKNEMGSSFNGKSKDLNYWIINPTFTNQGSTSKIEVTFQDLPTHGVPNITIDQGLSTNQSHNIAAFAGNSKELSLHIPIGRPVRIKFESGEKAPLPFFANYHIIDDCSDQVDSSKGFGSITSKHFPSAYPLNALCDQTLKTKSPNKKLHLSFNTLQLASSHSVRIKEATKGGFNATYMTGDLPNDILLNGSNVQITLNSEMTMPIKDVAVGQGYKIDFTVLDCGGNLTAKTGKFSTPGFPKNSSVSVTCVWIVTVPLKVGTSSPQPSIAVLRVNATQLKGQTLSNYLEIYDGPNVRSPLVNISTMSSEKSTFESMGQSIVIKYVNGKSGKGFPFQISYSTHDCSVVCDNGICLHDSWRCDGIDQCGDSTDEQNCNSGLVSKKTLGISVFCGMIATVVFIVVIAIVVFKYKQRKAYKRLEETGINT